MVDQADVTVGRVPVIAPAGFLAHAADENVMTGPAMARRSSHMYGAVLPKGPAGRIGWGLGQTTSLGTVGLIAPTVDVTGTGQTLTVDGIRRVFQLTPGTEAPEEMNVCLPDRRVLCVAENACVAAQRGECPVGQQEGPGLVRLGELPAQEEPARSGRPRSIDPYGHGAEDLFEGEGGLEVLGAAVGGDADSSPQTLRLTRAALDAVLTGTATFAGQIHAGRTR